MITFLRGLLLEKSPNHVTIDVSGIGYGVTISVTTYSTLTDVGSEVNLFTHLNVKEDALDLYGFSASSEREVFRHLISVSGVGPKTAIAILSSTTASDLANAIASGNVPGLTRVPGIGPKTAQRIVLELREKLSGTLERHAELSTNGLSGSRSEAIAGLVALGYPRMNAEKAVRDAAAANGDADTTQSLLRRALKVLSGG